MHSLLSRSLPRFSIAALLVAASPLLHAADLKLTETDDLIRITLGDKPVLEYVKTGKRVPEGISPDFSRSGYIHPVYNPTGQEVTGDFPVDHAHQHALFFAWTRTNFDGKKADFWNQAKKAGGIEHRGVLSTEQGDDQVTFTVKQAFFVGQGESKTDVLHETWKVTVHRTPEDHFLFDLESTHECASQKPLSIVEYHYGGMALRGPIEWLEDKEDPNLLPGDLQFVTSEGSDRLEANHSRPRWVSMSGTLEGQPTSITVLGSPSNFRAPQPVRIHPSKPYFCFAPMVLGEFQIEPGTPYVSRYRYLVTSKKANAEQIEGEWQRYRDETK